MTAVSQIIFPAVVIALVFAALAWRLRAVSSSGAMAGALVCIVLCACAGYAAFAALVSVFVLAWLTTKAGYREKERLGTAESREGRSAAQIFANLGVPAICSILFAISGRRIFLLALTAALAEAAADTVSSEIGQVSQRKARLITTWKEVDAGTDGGITLRGTVSGLLGAVIVVFVSIVGGMIDARQSWIPFLAAWGGTVADSVLGATAQRRALLSNNSVNWLGTLSAALSVFVFPR